MLNRTNEFNGSSVFKLIRHDLRNRKLFHRLIQSCLQTFGKKNARLDTVVVKLILLAVIDNSKLRRFAFDTERSHFLFERSCCVSIGVQTDLGGNQFLTERFIRRTLGNRGHFRRDSARRAKGGHFRILGGKTLLFQAVEKRSGKSGRKIFQSFRRQFFCLNFNQ